jgi:hypothetical protein
MDTTASPLRYTRLTREGHLLLPKAYALYTLRHDLTGKLFFGSTRNIRRRMHHWWYALEKPSCRAYIPVRTRGLLFSHGAVPGDWSYGIVSWDAPETLHPPARRDLRPEWPYIKRMHALYPERLLNDMAPVRGHANYLVPPAVPGRKGVSPLSYLGAALGLRQTSTRFRHGQPGHNWPDDPRELVPYASPQVPFALFLYRAMQNMEPRCMSPSVAAIEGLYRFWLAHVPPYEPVHEQPVPTTAGEAMNVSVPRTYI